MNNEIIGLILFAAISIGLGIVGLIWMLMEKTDFDSGMLDE